ncbi:putative toxin B domain protein, partial [Escherichia coli 90.0039]
YIMCSTK